MPYAAARPCAHPGCAAKITGPARYCGEHQRHTWQQQNRRRREDPDRRALDQQYRSSAWRRYSRQRLAEYPLCEQGQREGLIEPAAMTDHITPVDQGGDFWDPANHQSLCDRHHRVKSGRELVAKLNGSRA